MVTATEQKSERKAPAASPNEMTPGDMLKLMSFAADIGSIELKMTVPPENRASLGKLSLDTLQGRIREVVFFDTPDLKLYEAGVVLRGRRTQGKPEDTVVKLRPLPERLPPKFRTPDLKVEMDVTSGGYVVSASLKGTAAAPVRKVVDGGKPLPRLFTDLQRELFDAYRPPDVSWDDLVPLGPIYVVVLKHVPADLSRKITIEQWHYPGQIPLVELSTKSTPSEIAEVSAEAQEWLRRNDLVATGEQEPKTRKALEHYSQAYRGSQG